MTRTRDEIELDLPFAVNGSLTDAEMADFNALLEDDDLLRAEFDAMSVIRSEMQDDDVRSPGDFGLARLLRGVEREGSAIGAPVAPNRTWMWQLAAAVAMVAFLAQALFLGGDDTGGYQLAGIDTAVDADLVVTFAPDATEEQIRTLLVGLNAEIVAGPSALGFYQIDLIDDVETIAAAETLRAATGIVESVEDAQD